MARVYIDENSRFLVGPLRRSGHDVLDDGDAGKGHSDVWHFRKATSDRRIIITLDTGFYYIHGLWMALMTLEVVRPRHAGILTSVVNKQFDEDEWEKTIQTKVAIPEELSGRNSTWHPDEKRCNDDLRRPWKGTP